jgi:hypothetical protein
MAYHNNQQLFAIAHHHHIFILDKNNPNQPLYTLVSHYAEVTALHFFHDSLLVGTKEGRVLLYTLTNTQPLIRLCSFPLHYKGEIPRNNNYVSAFASYENIVACSGYGGGVVVLNPNTLHNKTILQNNTNKVTALSFVDATTLLVGTIKGELLMYQLYPNITKIYTISTSLSSVDTIVHLKHLPLVLLSSTQDNHIVLVHLHTQEVVKNHYLHCNAPITDTFLDNNTLFVALKNKHFLTFELFQHATLLQALQKQQLPEAFEIVEDDPLLRYTPHYQQLQTLYEQHKTQALHDALRNKKEKLQQLIKNFSKLPKQKKELQEMHKALSHYTQLQNLYNEQKYHLALNLAYTYPLLKQTPLYTRLEHHFTKIFQQAQKHITRNNPKQAHTILAPYTIVNEKKEIVTLLLRDNTNFIKFLHALQNKEYVTLFSLVKKHTLFTKIAHFQHLLHFLDGELQTLYTLLEAMQIETLREKITQLQGVPHFKTQLQELYYATTQLQKLLKLYDNTQLKECYELLDINPLLQHTLIAKELETHFVTTIKKSQNYALQGDVLQIKKELKTLLLIATRKEKIGSLLRVAFRVKIRQLLKQRSFHSAENMIYSYIDFFSFESELQPFIQELEKNSTQKIAISLPNDSLKRDGWRESPLMVDYAK